MRWKFRIKEFDFEIVYKKGRANTQADALSRLRTLGETVSDFDDDITCFLAGETSALKRGEAVDSFANAFPNQDPVDRVEEVLALQTEKEDEDLFDCIYPEELAREQYKDEL